MSKRLFRLMEHYQKLDAMIAAAQRRRGSDGCELLRLKTLKLAIKERIARAMKSRTFAG
ncbi:YdcH family protein [Aurantiacibacter luteus]|uniref:YdcH family protein n=1 Tax=Aurantiacibacter luteus TaxID=1581420 RepID=UPI0009E5B3AB|nr:YdcH family protein [Aurantiacibacter luteus]